MPVPNESHERNKNGGKEPRYVDTNPAEDGGGGCILAIPFKIAMWIFDFLFAEKRQEE